VPLRAITAAVFGLIGLGVVLLFSDPGDLLAVRNLSAWTLFSSTLLLGWSFLCGGLRLRLLARTLGYRLRLPSAVRAHILGLFSAAVTPSGSGNAPAIALMLTCDGLSRTHAWSVALYTGLVDLLFFAWGVPVALLTLKLSGKLPPSPWWSVGGAGVSALFLALWYLLAYRLSALPGLAYRLCSFRILRRYRGRTERFAQTFTETVSRLSATTWSEQFILQAFSASLHLSVFAMFSVIAADLGLTLPLLPTLATLFLIFVVSHVVPTPGGSGFLELTLPLLLMPERPAAAVPALLVWRLLSFYSVFLLGPSLGGAALAKRSGPDDPSTPPHAETEPDTAQASPKKRP